MAQIRQFRPEHIVFQVGIEGDRRVVMLARLVQIARFRKQLRQEIMAHSAGRFVRDKGAQHRLGGARLPCVRGQLGQLAQLRLASRSDGRFANHLNHFGLRSTCAQLVQQLEPDGPIIRVLLQRSVEGLFDGVHLGKVTILLRFYWDNFTLTS